MTRSRDNVQISAGSLDDALAQLNFILQRFNDRLDALEGIRGIPNMETSLNMNNNRIENAGIEDDESYVIARRSFG